MDTPYHKRSVTKKRLLLSFLITILLLLTGCAFKSGSPSVDEDAIKQTAADYIKAEYNGDKEKLRQLTAKEALTNVDRGELDIFKGQLLKQIIAYRIDEITTSLVEVTVTVESQPDSTQEPSNYYEILTLERINGQWRVTRASRDI